MNLNNLNSFQTPVTKELRKEHPKEVWDDMLEYLSTVKFLQHLIAPAEIRGYAKDRPKETEFYNDGRIKVDITKVHILEDLDFFRERAIFFEKNNKYTNLIPNSNPKSEYADFWREELRRWKHGLVRPSDGEWIPGELYFYWNYNPIWLTENVGIKNLNKKTKGERVRKFPKPWLGDYMYYHYTNQAKNNGKHGKVLKTRGIGFSFKNASESPRNMYVFPGSGNPNFHLASDKGFLTGDKGIWGKILDTLDWIGENTPFARMRIVDGKRSMEVQLGYEDAYGTRKGLLSSVFGISLKDNPDKARGIRGPLIHYEEDGLFPNLEKAWNVNRKAVEDGDVSFGFMLAGGTGGVEGASFAGSEKLFYKPQAYNIYGIPNVFDKNTNGENLCGFFWGAYLNRNACYDETNGEPDVIKSLLEILNDRYIVKYNSSDPLAITQKKAEEPITPQEAVMRTEGTVFPIADLKEYLEEIAPRKESFLAEHLVGDLIVNSEGKVEWKPNSNIAPLRSFDSAESDRTGAVEIFEMPKKNGEGIVPRGRYIAGIDPVDSDTGQSLFSIIIMDLFTDRIVAEYSGRPRLASDAYETALRLLKFYNAEANYESNLKGLFSYFDNKNALYYLADVPQILKDMEMVKSTNLYGNKSKGTHANVQVNKWGRELQAEYMLTPILGQDTGDDEDEESKANTKLNLHTLRSIPYIEECISWNSDGNFDRVSAAGMLFILREDRRKRTRSAKENVEKGSVVLANDPYFNRNYKQKRYGF
jgi:hypothetical protein